MIILYKQHYAPQQNGGGLLIGKKRNYNLYFYSMYRGLTFLGFLFEEREEESSLAIVCVRVSEQLQQRFTKVRNVSPMCCIIPWALLRK